MVQYKHSIKEKLYNIVLNKLDCYMKHRKYKKAIEIYNKIGKPFWWSEEVGRYYEKRGLIKKAMAEYEFLINKYISMKILPLPKGPVELYKLGKWYIKTNPEKTRKYLRIYLDARRQCKSDPAFYLRYEKQAQKLLDKIQ